MSRIGTASESERVTCREQHEDEHCRRATGRLGESIHVCEVRIDELCRRTPEKVRAGFYGRRGYLFNSTFGASLAPGAAAKYLSSRSKPIIDAKITVGKRPRVVL